MILRRSWPWLVNRIFGLFSFSFFFGFFLFQKKVLPKKVSGIAAKFYFKPTLPLTYFRLKYLPPFAGLWTELDDTVIVGAAPITQFFDHPKKLKELGVIGVINCCAEFNGPNWSDLDIDSLRLPTIDHQEPSVDDLKKAIIFIQDIHNQGKKCYVHCKAGHGRSAAVAFSWLCHRYYGEVAPFDLYQRMAAKRKIRKNLFRQPNIVQFYESLPLPYDIDALHPAASRQIDSSHDDTNDEEQSAEYYDDAFTSATPPRKRRMNHHDIMSPEQPSTPATDPKYENFFVRAFSSAPSPSVAAKKQDDLLKDDSSGLM